MARFLPAFSFLCVRRPTRTQLSYCVKNARTSCRECHISGQILMRRNCTANVCHLPCVRQPNAAEPNQLHAFRSAIRASESPSKNKPQPNDRFSHSRHLNATFQSTVLNCLLATFPFRNLLLLLSTDR